MARLAMCGWESGNAEELGNELRVGATSGTSATSTLARGGTYSLRCRCAPNTFPKAYRIIGLPTNTSEVWIRIALANCVPNGTTYTTAAMTFLELRNGTVRHIALGYDVRTRSLVVYRDATVIASGGIMPSTSAFSCIEAHVVIHASSGVVQVWQDGVLVINFAGNTLTSGVGILNLLWVGLGQNSTTDNTDEQVWIDDFALNDTVGTVCSSRIGQGGIIALWPNKDTTDKDFSRSAGSDNYSLVNSYPPDDDTTYVQHGVVDDMDLYQFQSMPTSLTNISAVQLVGRMKSVYGSGAKGALTAKSDDTTLVQSWTAFGTAYGYQSKVMETDPDTGVAWTDTKINSLQAGLTVK